MADKIENDIINAFDNLDIEETDKLLYSYIYTNTDYKTLKRIKNSVYKKAGLKKSNSIIRKGLIVAAAAVLIMLSIVTVGVDNVASAFGRLFSFIPGYAIVENNKSIEYVIDGRNLTAENNEAILTITNVIATKDNINISFQIEKKNFDESKIIEEKRKEMEELEKGGQLKKPSILLIADGKEYKTGNFSIGGGSSTEFITASFEVAEENINSKTTYKLEYKAYDLWLEFNLKSYDSFDSLEEIGPTSTLNDISITAVANRKENKLEVELYEINKSKYRIASFIKICDNGYQGKDLNLQTSAGVRRYTIPGSYMGANNKFYFDISPEDKNLVLNIPYLLVSSDESQNISLKIPNEGEKVTINKKVEFKDCTMIFTEVERVSSDGNEYGDLRINIRYENKDKNKVMSNSQFRRTNLMGIVEGGGYSSSFDQNGITESIDFALEKGEDSLLRLKIENPEYYLLGEYNLEIK